MNRYLRGLRLLIAIVGGVAVYASYEPTGWWWAAILGVGLFFLALSPWGADRPGLGFGALIGLAFGLGNYLGLLPWIGEFVGALPYVALAIVLACYIALGSVALTAVLRWRFGLAAAPLVYLFIEFCQSTFPFGGFAWVRLAWGQIAGPLAALARYGGPALVTLAVCAAGAALTALVLSAFRRRLSLAGAVCVVVVLAVGLGAGTRLDPEDTRIGQTRMAAIQGNVPRMGLDFNAQRRAVLANHVRETERLAAEDVDPDLVIWPENASDVNPFLDSSARTMIESAVAAVDAPILVGTLTRDEVGARNTMVVFDPHGVGDHHDKKYLQPFGETMPMRDFFRLFSDYVDQAGDFKPGDGDGTVHMRGVNVGVATCYEVIVDAAYRDAVHAGAEILATPTNNATFGFTDMTYQQLAMSRMRAIELDRGVVVAATSGVSAIVTPDGTVTGQTAIFDHDHLVADLPLKRGLTPAARWGRAFEWTAVMMGGALAALALFTVRRRTHRRGTK